MSKNRERYQVWHDGKKYAAKATQRAAIAIQVSLQAQGFENVTWIDSDPPRAKPKEIRGDNFIMPQDVEIVDPNDMQSTITATRINRDVVSTLYSKRLISEGQKLAADKYHQAHIVCQGQTNGSIDYTKDRVDTSGPVESLTDAQIHAMDVIAQASKELDLEEALRVQKVVGDGCTMEQYCCAHQNGRTYKDFITKQTRLLSESLTKLAMIWGYESRARKKRVA